MEEEEEEEVGRGTRTVRGCRSDYAPIAFRLIALVQACGASNEAENGMVRVRTVPLPFRSLDMARAVSGAGGRPRGVPGGSSGGP